MTGLSKDRVWRGAAAWMAALFLALGGCVFHGPRPSVSKPEAAPRPAPKLPRVWALEGGSAPADVPASVVEMWRRRYNAWSAGTLKGYPFEPKGARPKPFDDTQMGKRNRQGEIVTENPVPLPEHSIHETEPWGDPGCVWPIRNRWSKEWEERFSDWMATEVDADYLARYGVAVDCADTPYAFRWIFARMHNLPQGAHNAEGAIFGNWNTRFADLPTSDEWQDDQRFRAALDYVLDKYVQGRSIPYDTYPIALSPSAGMLRPGTVVADKSHERIIHRILPNEYYPVRHLSATLPSKVRILADEALSAATPNDGPGWGIVDWSWWDYDFARRRYLCVPDRRMPGFSLEQYQKKTEEIPAGMLHLAYQGHARRAAPPTGETVIRQMIRDLVESIRVRRTAVDEGWAYYKAHPNDRSKKTRAYDDFSTPGRDARIGRKIDEIRRTAERMGLDEAQLDQEFARIDIPISHVTNLPLKAFIERLEDGKISHEPWDPPFRRWGFDAPFAEATSEPTSGPTTEPEIESAP